MTSYLSKTDLRRAENECTVQHLAFVFHSSLSSSCKTNEEPTLNSFLTVIQAIRANKCIFKVIDSQKLIQVWDLKEQKVFIMFLKEMSSINSFSCPYKPNRHGMPASCRIWY